MSLDPLTDNFAARLRKRRTEQLHLSQEEAAAQLGVSARTLQNWEAGETFPWPKHRRALIEFLNDVEESVA